MITSASFWRRAPGAITPATVETAVVKSRRTQKRLSLCARSDLLKLGKLSKRLITPLILLFLGLGLLSNRFFVLRQFTVRLNQNVSFHLPWGNALPLQADKRTFLLAISNESVSDLQQPPRPAIAITTKSAVTLRASWLFFEFQNGLSSRPPFYILQSALNL